MYNQIYFRNHSYFPLDYFNTRFVDPPASSDPRVISRRKLSNSKKRINTLPPELLSYIFMIAEEEERATRKRRVWYLTFQDRATRVCAHWRNVAINDPALWTYIHVTRPPPHRLAVLYLTRAGPTVPLDIDIEMRGSRFWKKAKIDTQDWAAQLKSMDNLLTFFVSYGANATRWRSVSLRAQEPDVLFKITGFLNMYSAPLLRSLSLAPGLFCGPDERRSLTYPDLFTDAHSLSSPTVPNLRSVEFIKVPWGFVFDRPLPLFRGLTKLSLTASIYHSPISKLRELLAANPLLESLYIDTGLMTADDIVTESKPQPVLLSSLRSLSIKGPNVSFWILELLRIVGAPALAKFSLFVISQYTERSYVTKALDYIASGRLLSQGAFASGVDLAIKPKYPSLDELDISKVHCVGVDNDMVKMLCSLSSVTRLSIAPSQAKLLEQAPTALPNLVYLKFSDGGYPQLGGLLRLRQEAGFPIQTVELPQSYQQYGVRDKLLRGVTVVEYDDESDSDYDAGSEDMRYWAKEKGSDDSYGSSDEEYYWDEFY